MINAFFLTIFNHIQPSCDGLWSWAAVRLIILVMRLTLAVLLAAYIKE